MRKEKVREGNGGMRTEKGGGGWGEEEMVPQGLVQHLKKKSHTQEKDVKYESKRERGGGGGEREREIRSVLALLFKITS